MLFLPLALCTHVDTSLLPSLPSALLFSNSREKKKRSADKTETRKQYVLLAERASNLWRVLEANRKKANSSSSNNLPGESAAGASTTAAAAPAADRPSQANMMSLLREIASLPNIELPPGGTCMHVVVVVVCDLYSICHPRHQPPAPMTHGCLSLVPSSPLPPTSDIPAKDMEKSLGGLKEVLATSRQYVAKVHDALNTTAGQPSTLADIKALLEELQQQPIQLRVRVIWESEKRSCCRSAALSLQCPC